MNKTRMKFAMLTMMFISGIFFYESYLQTFKLDVFPWGNSNNDGLYLLIIPYILLPSLLILLSLKWLILRKSTIANYFKSSAYIYFVLVLVIFQFAAFGFHLGNLLLGIFAGIMGVIELIAMFNQRNKFDSV